MIRLTKMLHGAKNQDKNKLNILILTRRGKSRIINLSKLSRKTAKKFQLTNKEFDNLMSQIVISSWGGIRKLPYAFTEHGVTMLASFLLADNQALEAIGVRVKAKQ